MLCQQCSQNQMPNTLQIHPFKTLHTQSMYMYVYSIQLEQVKGRHEVLSTRQRSTLTWTGSQFSYEGASLQAS